MIVLLLPLGLTAIWSFGRRRPTTVRIHQHRRDLDVYLAKRQIRQTEAMIRQQLDRDFRELDHPSNS